MRRAEIEEQNRFMVRRQREFRIAADIAYQRATLSYWHVTRNFID